ncbi:MAG TPA: hypothetical protein VF593_09460 [Chthoniobacteraceae bacterium]
MNFRLLLCIGMGVFVIHIGVVMILSHLRPRPKFVPTPKPNFTARAKTVTDPSSGEKTTYREITVSTRFTSPAPPAAATPLPQR